jgi:uroporphyrin-III C-methyltransferase
MDIDADVFDEPRQARAPRSPEPRRQGAAPRRGDAHGGRRVPGIVSLVGAGPGDPELLTLKAIRRIEAADAIVYDRLVATSLLEFAPTARRFYVGKARDLHALPQHEINALLVRLAREGERVVRLKGGDPFVFGRGGEEMEYLALHGIPFEVVPGISAANGIAASTCIPLTHREHAQRCIFVTGHLKDGSMDLDWRSVAVPGQTVVVYMGLAALSMLCDGLVRHGLPGSTPAAIVQQGTLPAHRVVTATLDTLAAHALAERLASPTLVIVGDVVRVRERVQAYAAKRAAPTALAS